jgi:hypothetical protein
MDTSSQRKGNKVKQRLTVDSSPSQARLRQSQNEMWVQAGKASRVRKKNEEADALKEARRLSAGRFWSQVPGGAADKAAKAWQSAQDQGILTEDKKAEIIRDFQQGVQQATEAMHGLMGNK